MTTEKSVLEIMKYLRRRINSTGCVYSSDCISRLACNWGAVDTADFFAAIDRLAKEGFLHVVRHPQSRYGQHEIYVKTI